MPLVRAAPTRADDQIKVGCTKEKAKDRTWGTAGNESGGEAEPSPDIERQSRNTSGDYLVTARLRCVSVASVLLRS